MPKRLRLNNGVKIQWDQKIEVSEPIEEVPVKKPRARKKASKRKYTRH